MTASTKPKRKRDTPGEPAPAADGTITVPVEEPAAPPAPPGVDPDDVFTWQSRRGPIAVLKVDRLRNIRPNLFARLAVLPGNPSIRFVRHLLEVCVDAAHPGDSDAARAVMDRLDYLDQAESTAFDEAWRKASNGLDPGN